MAEPAQEVSEMGVKLRRSRPRVESFARLNKAEIAQRIKKFYDDDNQNWSDDIDARLQRYAKYRMWNEPKNWPWEDASNFAMPDMMTASMRLQDTLHNAVMSSRPAVMAKATKKHDTEKEDTVNHLIDYQVFVEQPGEEIVGNLAHDFVNEGFYTAYVPWVKEHRNVVDVFALGEIPEGVLPLDFFRTFLEGKFPKAELSPSGEGWDWQIKRSEKKAKTDRASFFTKEDGDVEVEIQRDTVRYEGPRVIPKDVQDVLHPVRCENLQIPGPSNPMGASHVILRDYPTVDEIKRLRKSGFYDLISADEAESLGIAKRDESYTEREQQKDVLQGGSELKPGPEKGKESHGQLTRLMCFDCYDVDGDGQDEDVIFWMILETKTILRARYLTQMFPSNPPIRPLAEGHLFPVPGRRRSIGLLEMMEGLHDAQKQFLDQGGDAGTVSNAPFFFYRATSNMRPETIRLWPGEGYPLNDPSKDVHFPQMGNQNQSFMFNMVTLLQQMEERLTTIGELQLGRVPHGKSSALRTVSGMQTILSQGDARPERVLRRFFIGLTQIWRIMHSLNQAFLPKNKQFMIGGYVEPDKDPYRKASPQDVAGEFMFDFSANALNTSKEALQMALQDLMGVYVSELALTLGVIKPDGIYRLLRDYGKAKGPDPDKYLSPPTPQAWQPPIFVEEVIAMIMDGQIPQGSPAEGAEQHLAKLTEYTQSDEFGLMPTEHAQAILGPYMQKIAQMAQFEAQKAALLQAAQQFGGRVQQPGKSGPAAMPQGGGQAMPMLQGGELADESLPGAGGGANQGVPA